MSQGAYSSQQYPVVIFHKDHLMRPNSPNGGAETATLALARSISLLGHDVIVAAQLEPNFVATLNSSGKHTDNVTYVNLGESYDTTRAFRDLETILENRKYILIVASRAQALLESRYNSQIAKRIFLSHEPSAEGLGISPKVIGQIADCVCCISDAQRQLVVQGGCAAEKVVVVPNGVNLDLFPAGDPEKRNYRKLVFAGALVIDKGLHLVVEAFHILRQRYRDLELDVYGSAALWGRENYLDLDAIARNVPGISFKGAVSQQELAAAYQTAGMVVIPSIYFDAFNLCAAEALSTGCPVVGSIHTGMREVIDDRQTGRLISPSTGQALAEELDELLRTPEILKEMSRRALAQTRGRFEWRKTALKILELGGVEARSTEVREEKVMESNDRKVGLLTTFNQRCGLAKYAQALRTAMPGLAILAEDVSSSERTQVDDPAITRCWKRQSMDYSALERALDSQRIEILHINGHPRFFEVASFAQFLNARRAKGMGIVLHLHSPYTIDPALQGLIGASDRIVVHSAENRLEVLANGARADQVSVIELGVEISNRFDYATSRQLLGLRDQDRSIVCFGFIQPHKGLDEVIQAVAQLRVKHPTVKLSIVGRPHHEDANAVQYAAALRKLVEAYQLGGCVTFYDDFVSDDAVQQHLTAADVVVMNYRSNYYESSAAVASAIGCGAAIVASTAPTFARLGGTVFHATTGFPLPLAIDCVLSDEALRDDLRAAARRYAEANSMQITAAKFQEVYRSIELRSAAPVITRFHSSRPLRVLMMNRPNALIHRGGDTVVMERVAEGLRELGLSVDIDLQAQRNLKEYDLVHLHNFATPELTEQLARRCVAANVPYVVTTMYEDLPTFFNQMIAHFRALEGYISSGQPVQAWPTYAARSRQVTASSRYENTWTAENARALIASGEHERQVLMRDYPRAQLVETYPLGSETAPEAQSAELFINQTGIRDFILCVGRLETRKNQLSILKALENSPLTVVFVTGGFTYQPEYEAACRAFKRLGRTVFLDRLDPELLASAYAAAKAHVLPSWYELPGIVSIEAARLGCPVVVTDRGTVRDYFGERAFYCSPDDTDSIAQAIERACQAPRSVELQRDIEQFTWKRAAEKVLSIYQQALSKTAEPRRSAYALPEWDAPQSTQEIIQQSLVGVTEEADRATQSVAELAGNVGRAQPISLQNEISAQSEEAISDAAWATEMCEEGDQLAHAGRYDEASLKYQEALETMPMNNRAHRSSGVLALLKQDFKKAEQHFRNALRSDVNDARSLAGLGSCLWGRGERQPAYDLYRTAAAKNPGDSSLVFHLMNAAYAIQKMDDLEDALRAYLEIHPDDQQMRYCLAGCLFKQRKLALAQSCINEILQKDPDQANALELRDEIEKLKLSKNPTAESKQPGEERNLPDCMSELEIARGNRDWFVVLEIASEIIDHSRASKEQVAYSRVLKGEALAYIGELDLADAELQTAAESRLYRARALTGRGAVAATRQAWQNAEAFFREALSVDEVNDNATAGLGICASQRGEMENAWQYFSQAARLNPENKRALLGVIQTGYPLRRLNDVANVLSTYLELHPADLDMLYSYAGCLYAQGQAQDAIRQLDKIRLFNPDHQLANELRQKISTDRTVSATAN